MDENMNFKLSPENLARFQQAAGRESLLSKYLREQRKRANDDYRTPERSKSPESIRRIASTSTVKSYYVDSPGPQSSKKDRSQTELASLVVARKEKTKEPVRFTQVFFNILVVGDSGLGKTSFINTFLSLKFNRFVPAVLGDRDETPTRQIQENCAEKVEGNLTFKVKMIDTPGYGKFVHTSEWMSLLYEYIASQVAKYKEAKDFSFHIKPQDSRVHLCLYFIEGPRCKRIDLKCMHYLHRFVNLIPVVAKADGYTSRELIETKLNILKQAAEASVKFFDVAAVLDDVTALCEAPLAPLPPFSVISDVSLIEEGSSHFFYGRKYVWGKCDIDDNNHSDFALLSGLLVGDLVYPCVKLSKRPGKKLLKALKLKKDRENWKQSKYQGTKSRIKWWGRVISKIAHIILT